MNKKKKLDLKSFQFTEHRRIHLSAWKECVAENDWEEWDSAGGAGKMENEYKAFNVVKGLYAYLFSCLCI